MPLLDPLKRAQYQAQSYAWADSFDGQEVIIFFSTQRGSWPYNMFEHNIIGMAKRVNHNFKWGRIRVWLHPDEYPRIVRNTPTMLVHGEASCTIEPHGLTVKADPLGWYTDVLWSERDAIRLWEPYKAEYVMERLQEVGTSSK